eukprot:CAMPEP_0194774394 /NCGR_PEP_ID=MMETSP0323_2-20130528/57544_1 /TAXON_ID=2866 ORGANISM="Crypthecodinium cohnii, Strain Seligo" /NCGR_SAMPLE_ID=MMETSP0323_2 /ASSEMBLY_ACC=CAM_ASM_000346 /LENGTH=49 /DNA_ID=CAMNT_0039709913 /DNA_START=362 /DNA_END=511 /DNA_ORIENTATION=+
MAKHSSTCVSKELLADKDAILAVVDWEGSALLYSSQELRAKLWDIAKNA